MLKGETMPATERIPVFWNLSNHPLADTWGTEQIQAAMAWGRGLPHRLEDFAFPMVDPRADAMEVERLAGQTLQRLLEAGADQGDPVMLMGEFTLVCILVTLLQAAGLVPVVATSGREACTDLQPGGGAREKGRFRFVRFRAYPDPRNHKLAFPGSPVSSQ